MTRGFTTTITIRIDRSILAKVAEAAEADRRSTPKRIEKILADWAKQENL